MSTWTRPARVATCVAALACVACRGDAAPPDPALSAAPRPDQIVTLTRVERARVPEVLAERRGDRFSRSAAIKDNARVFLWLVETASDAEVTTAALHALLTTWTHSERHAEQLQRLTPEYARVVAQRLDDQRPAVQAAALGAAVKCLLGPRPEPSVVDHVVRLASGQGSAALRNDALEILWNSSTIRAHPEQIAPFVQALEAPEPWLVSGALFRLSAFGTAWPEQGTLRATLRQLLRHPDPGVRGRAATTLSNIVGAEDRERDEVSRALLPLLHDAHGFPRSAAATALAWLDFRPAVVALLPLLDDTASNTYDLRDYTRLDGTPGWTHHDGSPWSRVDDAALRALQSFSARLGTRFAFDIRRDRVDLDLAAAGRAARAWYATVRESLPPAAALP